jgi:hypothetical protein
MPWGPCQGPRAWGRGPGVGGLGGSSINREPVHGIITVVWGSSLTWHLGKDGEENNLKILIDATTFNIIALFLKAYVVRFKLG